MTDTNTITPEEVAAKAKAATPGPWVVRTETFPHYLKSSPHTMRTIRTSWVHPQLKDQDHVVQLSFGAGEAEGDPWRPMVHISEEDAALIAAAPAMARLIATQAAEIERLGEALKLAVSCLDVADHYTDALRQWAVSARAALEQEGG